MTARQATTLQLRRFIVWGLAACAALAWLGIVSLLIEGVQSVSLQSGLLLAGQALAGLLLLWAALRFARNAELAQRSASRIRELMIADPRFRVTVLIALALGSLCWLGLFLPESRAIQLIGGLALYLPRLSGFLGLGLSLAVFLFGLALLARYGWQAGNDQDRSLSHSATRILLLFIIAWALIALTGFGLGFDYSEWNAPGAPVLFSQVLIALVLAGLGSALLSRSGPKSCADLVLFLGIWLLAAWLWNAQPAAPTYYSSAPIAPSQQSFPRSDAFNHDVIANNLLIGEGLRFGDLQAVRKPLYAGLLALGHWLTGSDHARLLQLQVTLLALFPALLFLLGRQLHSRFAGLALAAVIIWRESNSLQLGDVVNLSHAKLLMADFPAALSLALFCLLALHWFTRKTASAHWALLVGGLLGLLLLLRSQHLTVIAVLALFLILAGRAWQWRARRISATVAIFLLGVILTAGPWLLRNRALTGQWILEHSTAISYLAQRYQPESQQLSRDFLPGESEGDYYARYSAFLLDGWRQDPAGALSAVAENYVRNLLLTVAPLPLTLELWDLESHVREQSLWPRWDGSLTTQGSLLMLANLSLLALGLSAAWKRWGWAGLLPLAVLLGFTLNLALARVSGWRYNQPVDWIVLLYWLAGLATLLRTLALRLGLSQRLGLSNEEAPILEGQGASNIQFERRAFSLTVLALLLAASSLLLAERLIPQRYTGQLAAQSQAQLAASEEPGAEWLGQLWEAGQLRAFEGRALYPRYLRAGQGETSGDFALTTRQDFDRLTLFLLGPDPLTVVMPLEETPGEWQSGMDALVLTCRSDTSQALALLVFDEAGQLAQDYYSVSTEPCP